MLGASTPSAVAPETQPAKTLVPGLGWTEGFTSEDLAAALAAGDREEVERILRLRSSHAPGTPNRLIGRALRAEQDGDAEEATELWRRARLVAEAWRSVSGDDAHVLQVERYRHAGVERRARYLEASGLFATVQRLQGEGDLDGAERVVNEARDLWRRLDDPRNEADFLHEHCRALRGGARGMGAMADCFGEAARLYAEAGSERQQAECLADQAWGLEWAVGFDEALAVVRQARQLAEALHDDWLLMRILIDEGRTLDDARATPYDQRFVEEADATLMQAVELARRLGDAYWEAQALENLAPVRARAGRHASANELRLRAIALRESVGQDGERLLTGYLAREHVRHGEHLKAVRYLERKLELTDESAALERLRIWKNLAKSRAKLGDTVAAVEAFDRALALAEGLDDAWNRVHLLSSRGSVQCEDGDDESASRSFEAAAGILEGWPSGRRRLRESLALAYKLGRCGRSTAERAELTRAIALATELGLEQRAAYGRSLLGLSYLKDGDSGAAEGLVAAVQQALLRLDASGWDDRGWRTECLYFLARHEAAQGRHAEAWPWYRELLDELERSFPLAFVPVAEQDWIREEHEHAIATLRALIDSGAGAGEWLDESLRLAQATQAVRLRALIAERQDRVVDDGDAPLALLDRKRRRVSEDIAALRSELGDGADDGATAVLEERLATLEDEHDLILERRARELRARRREELAELSPLGLDEVRVQLASGTAAVQYFVGKRQAFAWIVRSDAARLIELAPPPEIAAVASFFLKAVSSPGQAEAAEGASAELFELLVEPLLPALGDASRLVVIPDGLLHRIPLEALAPDGGEPLVATREVAYLPALALLGRGAPAERRPAGTGASALIVGDWQEPKDASALPADWQEQRRSYQGNGVGLAPLVHARREARRVARLFPRGAVELLLGGSASEAAVKAADISRRDILHFATHAIADERSPMRSALVLAPSAGEDGFLQVRELAGLDLGADLVVLSGCSTGGGRLVTGEGVEGLARAFLVAGARSLVVSLWNVDDRSTALLMELFHRRLRAGQGPAAALRQAKLELRRRSHGRYAAPYYWAPFVIIGEPDG